MDSNRRAARKADAGRPLSVAAIDVAVQEDKVMKDPCGNEIKPGDPEYGKPQYDTREAWLRAAAERTGRLLAAAGPATVPAFHVSVGFPKGHHGRGRAIGQCWPGERSADGACHVFVCPTLGSAAEVLHVLLHEQVHATVGCAEGHRGAFSKTAKAVGLQKPWTATTPGPELKAKLDGIQEELGAYPHSALAVPVRGLKGSRLRLWECGCGVKVRVASDDFRATCGRCEEEFKERAHEGVLSPERRLRT